MRKNLLAVAFAAAVLIGSSLDGPCRVFADGAASTQAGGAGDAKLTAEQIKDLVGKLGADDFKTRSAAHEGLVKAGSDALEALQQATKAADAEVAAQATAAILEIHRNMAEAAGKALEKQPLWCYEMDKGAVIPDQCAWPVVAGDTGYLVGMDSKFSAVDLTSGKARWTVDVGRNGPAANANISAGAKYVSLLQLHGLRVYDVKEGKLLWQKDLKPMAGNGLPAVPGARGGAHPGMPPIWFLHDAAGVVGDLVAAQKDNALYVYNGQSGEQMWTLAVNHGDGPRTVVFAGDTAFLSDDKAVIALDPATQKELWKKELPECIGLIRSGPALVCMTWDKLMALDPKTGAKLWETNLPGGEETGGASGGAANRRKINPLRVAGKMVADDTRAYIVLGDTLISFDLKSGEKAAAPLDLLDVDEEPASGAGGSEGTPSTKLKRTTISAVMADKGTVYAATPAGVIAFDGKSGTKLFVLPVKSLVQQAPVVAGGVLYYTTRAPQASSMLNAKGGKQAKPAEDFSKEPPQDQPGLHAVKLDVVRLAK